MKFLRMALSAALLTLSANANAMLIELRADYDNGSYIEFSAVVPDSYVFSDGLNLGTARSRAGSPAITYDSLSLTAYWAPDNLTHTTSDGSELSLYEDPLDADNIFDGTGSDGFEYRFSYDLSRYIFDGNTVVHSYKIIPNSRESFQIVDFAKSQCPATLRLRR